MRMGPKYFRGTMTAPFLDNLISHLDNWLTAHSEATALGSNITASGYLQNPTDSSKAIHDSGMRLASDVTSELPSWVKKMEALPETPSTAAATRSATDHVYVARVLACHPLPAKDLLQYPSYSV